jgi:3-hydroxyacyl-[acyl-carrier-protein] dehydratase
MLDFEEVKKYLPQQFPMLMVDRVLTYEKGKAITAIKNVTGNELFFQGHFPEKAIMPGAFILEGLGQCSVIL